MTFNIYRTPINPLAKRYLPVPAKCCIVSGWRSRSYWQTPEGRAFLQRPLAAVAGVRRMIHATFAALLIANTQKAKRPREAGVSMGWRDRQRCWASSGDGATAGAGAGGAMAGLTASAAWRAALPLAQ